MYLAWMKYYLLYKIPKDSVWDNWIFKIFSELSIKLLSYQYFHSELIIKRIMALKKRNSEESYGNQMFLQLQQRFKNVPIVNTINIENVKASKKSGCSIYPNILDLKYSNTYWQIFNNRSATFHLYGAYFGRICKIRALNILCVSCFR